MAGNARSRARILRNLVGVLLMLLLALPAATALAQEYTVRKGDVLDVLVIGEPEFTRLVTVTQEGTIFIPLVGNVQVEGLTLKQVEERLTQLIRRYVREPRVVVTLRAPTTERDYVYVLGQVARPGPYEYRRGWTVAELLAQAGGATPRASLPRSLILRRSEVIPVNLERLLVQGDVSQNPELRPGDVLVVPEINERVLMLGEVSRPGYQDLRQGDRVLDVITRAGGPTIKSAPENISVLRNGTSTRISLETFYKTGDLTQNPLVEAGDVVLLPETDRRVLVLGEVAKPGRYTLDLRFPNRVLDLVTEAGGTTKTANLAGAVLLRQEGDKTTGIPINLTQALRGGGRDVNVVLRPGDVIYVPPSNLSRFQDVLQSVLDLLSGVRLLQVILGL
jgi:protein involved in polysaccharide export with SLBB domain